MANASRIVDRSRSIPIPIQKFDEARLDKGDSSSSSDDDDDDDDNDGINNNNNNGNNQDRRGGLEEGFTGLSLGNIGIQRRIPVFRPLSLPPNAPLLVSRGSGERQRYVHVHVQEPNERKAILFIRNSDHVSYCTSRSRLLNYQYKYLNWRVV